MSRSPSYEPEPDDSSDSDFSLRTDRGRQRQRRTLSHHDPFDSNVPEVQVQIRPTAQVSVPVPEPQNDLEEPKSSQSRWDRLDALVTQLNPNSLAQYKDLLDEYIYDVAAVRANPNEAQYSMTQNGAVSWTSREKHLLFKVLDKKGKNGIRQMAATIGTKSEVEVADYLSLLHRGLESQHILEPKIDTIVMGDIPSAIELSKECCEELDRYAQGLVMREDIDQELACRSVYAENALIGVTEGKALVAKEINPPLRGSIHHAANLLNVPMWPQLSAQFFMNFGGHRAEDSWTNIVKSRKESPGIYGDALMDFYALTMSITRRLMQSTIFFAMARLRAMSGIGRARRYVVRKRDVRAAVDVLNMKHDRAGFFVDVSRRNRITITDDLDEHGEPRLISYDEAEDILRNQDETDDSDTDDEESTSDDEHEDNESKAETGQPKPVSPSTTIFQPPYHFEQSSIQWSKIPLEPEEEHADLLDLAQNRREEGQLWDMLEIPAPSHLNIPIAGDEDETSLVGRKPYIERKTRENLVDWRERTIYRSEWEEYGDDLQDLEDELAENRRKRRWSMPGGPLSTEVIQVEDSSEEEQEEIPQDDEMGRSKVPIELGDSEGQMDVDDSDVDDSE
ncbi:uncharacterized protein N7483_001510 [Penicillium malachiteum]|uniref:uncharacterized protein n=1 Tax=Penicillium malachiteum TaxID=1324776 RepID=UPI0025498FAE|nr:uncharacterized protein N7483_001510 [Penicillium malachiteum]KAJ5736385.1 hypothetical protein N7483_001510 [Penicillium malachiteum]